MILLYTQGSKIKHRASVLFFVFLYEKSGQKFSLCLLNLHFKHRTYSILQMQMILSDTLFHFRRLFLYDLFISIAKFNFFSIYSVEFTYRFVCVCVSFTINQLIMHSTMVCNGIIYSLLKKKKRNNKKKKYYIHTINERMYDRMSICKQTEYTHQCSKGLEESQDR